jgi:hypothetical protein
MCARRWIFLLVITLMLVDAWMPGAAAAAPPGEPVSDHDRAMATGRWVR